MLYYHSFSLFYLLWKNLHLLFYTGRRSNQPLSISWYEPPYKHLISLLISINPDTPLTSTPLNTNLLRYSSLFQFKYSIHTFFITIKGHCPKYCTLRGMKSRSNDEREIISNHNNGALPVNDVFRIPN